MQPDSLITSALRAFADGLQQDVDQSEEKPSEWIQKHFYVHDPRDPVTGKELGRPGPIILAEHQIRIVDEALSKKENGDLKYSTVIYSAPKKSGKSALSSAVVLYIAYHNPFSYIACISNDKEQAANRLYGPIRTNFVLHKQQGGIFSDTNFTLYGVTLENHTKIEPIPCDAAGEAGSQPLVSAWSELWGFDTPKKMRLFSEMTIPPTLYGRAIRWIESYAGFTGVSVLLERMYELGVEQGLPHPDFLDLQGDNGPVVTVNEGAGVFCYWDTEPRMPWQSPAYYSIEEKTLVPVEFRRIHKNEWVAPVDSFIQEEWWDACENEHLPVLESASVPVVVAIDMAETRDCAALVAVTRDPFNPKTQIAVRGVKIFNPKELGGIIDQELMVRPEIMAWAEKWNVVCWVYDPREMAKLAQDLVRDGVGWFKKFGQTTPRAVSDKALHDMVVSKQITWNRFTTYGDVGYKGTSNENLYRHLTLAGGKVSADSYRLVKLSNSHKIDAAVALSMAAHVAMGLAISNDELNVDRLIEQYRRREISESEFTKRVQAANPKLLERLKQDGHS